MNLPLILSALSLALCVAFFFYFRSFIKHRTAATELLAEYRDEVYHLIAEIDAATDRDSLLVEERIKRLRALLEDTDKRIAVYVRELDRSRTGEALYTSLGRGIKAALVPQSAPAPAETMPLFSGESPPPESPAREEALPPEMVRARGRKRAAAREPAAQPSLRSRIAGLAAEGLSSAQIAARLNVSRSEVDLAIHLLGNR